MASKAKLVKLLQFLRQHGKVTRIEAGKMVGKKRNTIARLCYDHGIAPWPRYSKAELRNRPCQFPVKELPNDGFEICGRRTEPEHPHVCKHHRALTWPLPPPKPEPIDPVLLS